MRLPLISLIAVFFTYFIKVYLSHIFPHKLVFLMAVLNYLCFYFLFLLHFITSAIWFTGCQQNDTIHVFGPLWRSWFQAILYHISAYFRHIFGVYAVRIFFKCLKTDMPSLCY